MSHFDDPKRAKTSPPPQTDNTAPSAQHVWLAGLGAMAKAQEQGSKAIEALLNDGLAFQRKSQAEAQQRLHEATERLSHMASDFGQQATGRVDKLEHLFEDRVAKALHRLGMPTLLDIQMLTDRVAQLESQLSAALKTSSARASQAPRPTSVKTAGKPQGPSSAKSKTPSAAKSAAKSGAKTGTPAPAPKSRSKTA